MNKNQIIINCDALELIKSLKGKKFIIITDPPFNIGYKYQNYKDNMEENDYLNWLKSIFTDSVCPFVVVHYPEMIYKLSIKLGIAPNRVVSWVYNSNTSRQHRDIAFFNIKPDFRKVIQPYKNLNDKRIKERLDRGILGGKLYDWWNVNQVKNVSKVRGGLITLVLCH